MNGCRAFALSFVLGMVLVCFSSSAFLPDPALAATKGKLSQRLALLAQAGPRALALAGRPNALGLPSRGPGSLTWDGQGRLLAYVRLAAQGPADLSGLAAAGAEVVHLAPRYGMATVWIFPQDLHSLAAVGTVRAVQEVLRPFHFSQPVARGLWWCTGQYTAESATLTHAIEAREMYGTYGEGVRVGIISDSFAVKTDSPTAATDVLTGDLPGPGNACGWTVPVTVSREGPASSSDEGRAMAQIVHDIAPAAWLYFATAFYGIFDFADQIQALWQVDHCTVIVDDISSPYAPFFQDGPLATAVDAVTDEGVFYYTSAGNLNLTDLQGTNYTSYQAPAFRPMTFNFSAEDSDGEILTYDTVHDFDPGSGTDANMNYILKPGGKLNITLQWAEPWYGIQTDIDLFIMDENNQILAGGTETNTGSLAMPWPFETASYINTGSDNQTVAVVIARRSGQGVPAFRYLCYQSSRVVQVEYHSGNSTDTFGLAIFGNQAAAGANTVAAVPYNDINTPEAYTSMGNPILYYGPVESTSPAEALAEPETREKPDFTVPDGVANTFFGEQEDGVWRFYGTSASAPGAAGVGALLKSRAGQMGVNLTPAQAKSFLQLTASVIANGSARSTGAGLVNALAALAAVQDNSGPQAWVERLYNYALNRDPTTTERDDWVSRLLAGTAWGETVARSLFNSAEFATRNLSADDFIATVYRGLIGKEITSTQLAAYRGQLAEGLTRAEFIEMLIALPDFSVFCQRYDVTAQES